jgi:hypothetical protein
MYTGYNLIRRKVTTAAQLHLPEHSVRNRSSTFYFAVIKFNSAPFSQFIGTGRNTFVNAFIPQGQELLFHEIHPA